MKKLTDYTPARVGLGVAGESLPTQALLDFRLAHARARDAVHVPLDVAGVAAELSESGYLAMHLTSAAKTRDEFLRRPDQGRELSGDSTKIIREYQHPTAIVISDGLSALAVHRHAVPLLKEFAPDNRIPIWIVENGRVAIGDHIGALLRSELAIVLLGERPGLSSPDSLGIYITWAPRFGRTDAERNCISNIHDRGLSYAEAARRLAFITNEARTRKLTGVSLKECDKSLGI